MRSRVVEAVAPPRVPYFVVVVSIAMLTILLILTTPARAHAQAEWNIGPFLDYSTIHGGHPATAGLQTGVLVGPIGTAIEIAPPLTSTRAELDRVANVMDQSIGEIERERNLA